VELGINNIPDGKQIILPGINNLQRGIKRFQA
jgi:hypothetical protein